MIYRLQSRRILQIGFGNHQQRLNLIVLRDGDQLIQQHQVRQRFGDRGDHRQLIQIGNRRSHQQIASRQDTLKRAGLLGLHGNFHPVTGHRRDPLATEAAARLTFIDRIGGFHVIETADAL